MLFLLSRKTRRWTLPFAMLAVIGFVIMAPGMLQKFTEGTTFQRLQRNQEHEKNSIEARLLLFTDFDLTQYTAEGLPVPFIGGGFYVAPTYTEGIPRYRVGYGVHNAYLFAFEQGGIVAFVLFIAYVISCGRYLWRARIKSEEDEREFINAMFAIYVGTVLIGMAGHGFWYGSTVHYSFYLLLLYLIAGRPLNSYRQLR
jgi:hypothetical protein